MKEWNEVRDNIKNLSDEDKAECDAMVEYLVEKYKDVAELDIETIRIIDNSFIKPDKEQQNGKLE